MARVCRAGQHWRMWTGCGKVLYPHTDESRRSLNSRVYKVMPDANFFQIIWTWRVPCWKKTICFFKEAIWKACKKIKPNGTKWCPNQAESLGTVRPRVRICTCRLGRGPGSHRHTPGFTGYFPQLRQPSHTREDGTSNFRWPYRFCSRCSSTCPALPFRFP